jgi:hypothetical protein
MEDSLKLNGTLNIKLTDENGNVKDERDLKNLVVTAGKNWVATFMSAGTGTVMTHMAVGTGTVAAADANTTLGTELSRVALNVSGGTRTNNSIAYVGVYGAGVATGALTEAGLFNAASVGTMLSRVVYSVINKGAADSLTITWTITVG